MGEMKNVHIIVVGEPGGRSPRCRWVDYIKMDLKK
jgi:hypothetical protein